MTSGKPEQVPPFRRVNALSRFHRNAGNSTAVERRAIFRSRRTHHSPVYCTKGGFQSGFHLFQRPAHAGARRHEGIRTVLPYVTQQRPEQAIIGPKHSTAAAAIHMKRMLCLAIFAYGRLYSTKDPLDVICIQGFFSNKLFLVLVAMSVLQPLDNLGSVSCREPVRLKCQRRTIGGI